MKLPAQLVKLRFERPGVNAQLPRQPEEGKVVRVARRRCYGRRCSHKAKPKCPGTKNSMCGRKKSGWRARLPTTRRCRSSACLGRCPPKENRRPETTGDKPKCLSRCLRGKRTATAATARRVGILEDESLAHQVFLPLQRGVVEIEVTLGVHKQPRAMLLEDFVAVARLRLEPHRVGQARAAAALHTYAKPAGFGGGTALGAGAAGFF